MADVSLCHFYSDEAKIDCSFLDTKKQRRGQLDPVSTHYLFSFCAHLVDCIVVSLGAEYV